MQIAFDVTECLPSHRISHDVDAAVISIFPVHVFFPWQLVVAREKQKVCSTNSLPVTAGSSL